MIQGWHEAVWQGPSPHALKGLSEFQACMDIIYMKLGLVIFPISFVESLCDPSHSMVAWCSDQDNFDLKLLYFFHEHQWGFCMPAVKSDWINNLCSMLCCWPCLIPCLTSSLPLRTVHAAYAWRESLMRLLSCFYFCFHLASLMDMRLVSKSNLIAFNH